MQFDTVKYCESVTHVLLSHLPAQRHPFVIMNEDNLEEIVGTWVIHMLDQFRIMRRYPSDWSLSSASSHSSGHFSGGVHQVANHSSSSLPSGLPMET